MLLNKIKKSLRITNNAFDEEIMDLINSAKFDLKISGVKVINETDPLIVRAITIYCKSNFGWDNPDSEKLQQSYDMLKMHLSLAGDYNAVE